MFVISLAAPLILQATERPLQSVKLLGIYGRIFMAPGRRCLVNGEVVAWLSRLRAGTLCSLPAASSLAILGLVIPPGNSTSGMCSVAGVRALISSPLCQVGADFEASPWEEKSVPWTLGLFLVSLVSTELVRTEGREQTRPLLAAAAPGRTRITKRTTMQRCFKD